MEAILCHSHQKCYDTLCSRILCIFSEFNDYGGYGTIAKRVTVKGVEVPITPDDLCDFYNIPYYEKDFVEEINFDKF